MACSSTRSPTTSIAWRRSTRSSSRTPPGAHWAPPAPTACPVGRLPTARSPTPSCPPSVGGRSVGSPKPSSPADTGACAVCGISISCSWPPRSDPRPALGASCSPSCCSTRSSSVSCCGWAPGTRAGGYGAIRGSGAVTPPTISRSPSSTTARCPSRRRSRSSGPAPALTRPAPAVTRPAPALSTRGRAPARWPRRPGRRTASRSSAAAPAGPPPGSSPGGTGGSSSSR